MANTCPKCGTDYPSETVICVKCGVDLRTGEALETEADPVRGPSPGMQALQFVGDLVPGLFRPALLITALLIGCVGLGILWFGWVLFGFGAIFGAVAIMAAGLVTYAQGIAWVLYGRFSFLPECLAEFNSNQWLLFVVVLFAPMAAFFILLSLAAEQAAAR